MKKVDKKEKKFLLRIPATIATKVQKRAAENQRSLNGQIVFELGQL